MSMWRGRVSHSGNGVKMIFWETEQQERTASEQEAPTGKSPEHWLRGWERHMGLESIGNFQRNALNSLSLSFLMHRMRGKDDLISKTLSSLKFLCLPWRNRTY